MTVSVCGLGKLGACMAAAIASRGCDVIGYDRRPEAVAALNAGRPPVEEPGLADLISAHRTRLRATTSAAEAVAASAFTFVVVPTPSDATGAFSLAFVSAACADIGAALATKSSFHHVVLCSTVLPGATRHGLIPVLERHSGKTCGRDFTVSYNPEFIALGSVIRDFLNPDFCLIGEFDRAGGDALEAFLRPVLANHAPCRRMSLENAEIAKIALNAYVTTKIAFANQLADFCEAVPGGDADLVCQALGSDARIGAKYFRGGLAFGGPCFPRDNRALAVFAEKVGCGATLPLATAASNEATLARTLAEAKSLCRPGARVAVLGLAYKSATALVEESPGLHLAHGLAAAGFHVSAHDPLAVATARAVLPASVQVTADLAACVAGAELIAVALPDAAYRRLTPADLSSTAPAAVVLDCWNILSPEFSSAPHLRFLRRGQGRDDPAAQARLAAWWTQP